MSESALRQLLASFVVEVDKAGALAKGSAQVDALKARLEALQAAAQPAAQAVGDAFAKVAASPFTQRAQAKLFKGRSADDPFLQLGQAALPLPPNLPRAPALEPSPLAIGPQFGPTRDTLNAARAATAEAEAAAAKYAGTLRGKLAGAVQAVKDGFNRGGGGGEGGGGGLIASLASFRTQMQLLAGSAVVVGIKRLVDGLAEVENGARRLGVSTDDFQRLDVLAKQNGTSVEALGVAFRNLSNAAVEPTKQTADAFAALGVQVKDGKGEFKSANDLFFDTTAALAGMGNETKRNALAQDLLGRSALELKPLFANGTKAVRDHQAAIMGLTVVSKDTIESAKRVSDSWKGLGLRSLAAAEPLLKILIPALTKLTNWVTKSGLPDFARYVKQVDLVGLGLTALAAVVSNKLTVSLQRMEKVGGGATKTLGGLVGQGLKAVGPLIQVAAQLEVLDDLITFLRGGKSETGEILDSVFGKGTAKGVQKAVNDLTEAFKSLWDWIRGHGEAEKAKSVYLELANGIDAMINGALAKIGLAKSALDGPLITDYTLDANGRLSRTPIVYGQDRSMPAPATAPTGQYGPPTAGEAAAKANGASVRDINVNVTTTPNANANDLVRAGFEQARDERNRLMAPVATF